MYGWIWDGLVFSVEHALAGAWDSLLHKGIGWAAIVVLLLLAFASRFLALIPFVGPILADFFKPLRKDLCWAAFGVALILGGEYVGARDNQKECVAQQVVVEHVVTKVVTKTKTPAASKVPDPYDSPEN